MITQEQVQAITRIAPDAQYNIVDGVMVWHSGEVTDEAIAENVAWFNSRVAAYPSIEDQLDDIYHNGIDAWKLTIDAVKESTPKIEE